MRLALVALVLTTMVACRAANSNDCTKNAEDCMSGSQVTYEEANAVRNKHKAKIRRQPHYKGVGAGREYGIVTGEKDPDGDDAIGIIIRVSELTDQSTLPEEDRIGDCLDGIPVHFHVTMGDRTMGDLDEEHQHDDPSEGLRSGVHVTRTARAVGSRGQGGTLTAFGSRRITGGREKVLITNRHVFLGSTFIPDPNNQGMFLKRWTPNPMGNEELFH